MTISFCKKCERNKVKKVSLACCNRILRCINEFLLKCVFCRLLKYGRSNLTLSTISWKAIKELNLKMSSLKNSRYEHLKIPCKCCRLKSTPVWVLCKIAKRYWIRTSLLIFLFVCSFFLMCSNLFLMCVYLFQTEVTCGPAILKNYREFKVLK